MNWIKRFFIVVIAIATLCFEQIVIACGGGEDPYDDVSFFHNNVVGSSAYAPLYYVSGYEYYYDWNDASNSMLEDDQNLKEWNAYSNNKFSLKAAADFVYKYNYDVVSNIYYHIEQKKPLQIPDSVKQNEMTQWFLNNKDLEALGYIMFAKRCETNATAKSDWDAPNWDHAAMDKNIKAGQQLLTAAQKDFFKWRYRYQVIRMAFYLKDYKQTLALHKSLIADKKATNAMYYRCLSLKAGAYYKLGDYSTAAYLYSLAFDGTDDNKESNYISYDWCFRPHGDNWEKGPKADKSAVLALTKNDNERAALAIMDALHRYENVLPLMKQAFDLNPRANGLDIVMVREINKLEQSVLTPKLNSNTGFSNYNYIFGSNYYNPYYNTSDQAAMQKHQLQKQNEINDFIAFAKVVQKHEKQSSNTFWPLAIAYLHYLKQDWAQTETWLATAERMNPKGRLNELLRTQKLLLAIGKHEKIDEQVEQEILPTLQWLEQKATKENRYDKSYYSLMTLVLPNAYMKQQDTMKALLCIAKGTTGPTGYGRIYSWWDVTAPRQKAYVEPGYSNQMEQVTTAKIIELKNWIKGRKASEYDNWLVKFAPYEDGDLDMYIGTRYLRQHDFAKAEATLKSVPEALMKRYKFIDPFAERWIDTQEPKDTLATWNKYTFAKEMHRLQTQIDKASAQDIYRYANGLYSMTYYGVAWRTDMYYRSGVDALAYYSDSSRNNLLPEYKNYYSALAPMKYYQLAIDKTNDKELKAKCLFMLSKCWQKSAEVPLAERRNYNPTENYSYYYYSLTSPYFEKLKNEYSSSKSIEVMMDECAYLRHYLKR